MTRQTTALILFSLIAIGCSALNIIPFCLPETLLCLWVLLSAYIFQKLSQVNAVLKKEVEKAETQCTHTIREIRAEHVQTVQRLTNENKRAVDILTIRYEKDIESLKNHFNEQISSMNAQHEMEIKTNQQVEKKKINGYIGVLRSSSFVPSEQYHIPKVQDNKKFQKKESAPKAQKEINQAKVLPPTTAGSQQSVKDSEIRSLNTKISTLEQELERFKNEVAEMKEIHSFQCADFESEIKFLKFKLATKEEYCDQLLKEATEGTIELENTIQLLEESKASVEQLEIDLVQSRIELESTARTLEEARSNLSISRFDCDASNYFKDLTIQRLKNSLEQRHQNW